jgi:small-conductance mechanosensitive channel
MIGAVPLLPASLFGLPTWASNLILIGVILAVVIAALAVIRWLVPHLMARSRRVGGPRARQRLTAVSALATGLRYLVLITAAVAIASILGGGGGLAALGGGALLVIVIGFASQRLLVDVIAGFFILFEDQYGVGDVIRVDPSGYTGTVRSLGLRTTVLTGVRGERVTIPNGNITAVHVFPEGRRPHRLELLTRDPDAVAEILRELADATQGAGGPWDAAPRITRRDAEGGLTRLIAIVDVDASREDAAGWLSGAVAARGGDLLVAPPLAGLDSRVA